MLNIDPNTSVGKLVLAIPSSVAVLTQLGISPQFDRDRTLQDACTEHGLTVEDFLRALNAVDWDQEYHP